MRCGRGGRGVAGLAHARVEAEVADELARRGEAADVADRGHERRRGLHVDARDGHQPQDLRPGERLLGDLAIERGDLGVEEVDLAQAAVECQPLVDGQLQPRQPAPARLAERVGDRRPLAEVARRAPRAPRSSRASAHARAARGDWSAAAAPASARPASTPRRAAPRSAAAPASARRAGRSSPWPR